MNAKWRLSMLRLAGIFILLGAYVSICAKKLKSIRRKNITMSQSVKFTQEQINAFVEYAKSHNVVYSTRGAPTGYLKWCMAGMPGMPPAKQEAKADLNADFCEIKE